MAFRKPKLAARPVPTTLVSLLSETTPLVSASVLFFLLVALLPTRDYGLMITITSSAMIISPIARAGAGIVLLRDIGQGREDQRSWSEALSTTLVATSIAVVLWVLVSSQIVPDVALPTSLSLFWQQLAPLAISDLAVGYLVVKGDMLQSLYARLTFAGWRVIGLIVFWITGSSSLSTLGLILLATSMTGAGLNVRRVRRHYHVTAEPHVPSMRVMTRGIPDSVSAATGSVLDSVDRPILTRAGFATDTARYGVSMRLVGLAGITTLALLRPYDRAVFIAGASSVGETTKIMIQASKRTLPTALISAALLWSIAGYVPEILPADYAETTDIIRWAVWMMPMRALSYPFGNLLLIPTYSWRAAVGTTLVAEAFMVIATMAACAYFVRAEKSAP